MGMYDEYYFWAQVAVLLMLGLYCTVWDRYMQVLYLGRAHHRKETLQEFHEKCRVTRHLRIFRGLMGSQRTPGNGASQRRPLKIGEVVHEKEIIRVGEGSFFV